MVEISLENKYPYPVYLALGFFDSVHFGHRKIINSTILKAKQVGAKAGIVTFSNNAYHQFNTESKLIYTYDERLSLLKEVGLDFVLPFNFSKTFKQKSKEEFLQQLFKSLNIVGVMCGYDYLFGSNGSGNAEYLHDYAANMGIVCDIVPPITVDNIRISSSIIKDLLLNGKIEQANAFLYKPFFMQGEIVSGRHVGKLFGFPTANLSFKKDKLIVKNGVYATTTYVDGKSYKSVTNVGAKPTFNEMSVSVETLLDNFDGNLYSKTVKLEFNKFLRDIQKFDSPQQLALQIKEDLSTYD